jgi:Ca2+-binding RTX toxin-like protein/methionine-rich copper-binding protein CopC
MAAPLLIQTLPADNATGVSVTSNLGLGFDQAVKAGSGFIRIYKSDGTLFHTIAITDSSQVTFSPTQPSRVMINPNVDLVAGTGYYILVDAGAIENLGGQDYAGISSSTALNFTTAGTAPGDATAPLLNTTSPADDAIDIAVGSNLVLTFNEAVQAGTGNIEIRKVSDGTIAKTIAITDATQITFSGSQLTINPTTDLAAGTGYYVTFASGVVRDLANNNFAGISSSTAFNFTTASAGDTIAPSLVSTTPLDNATGVSPQSNFVFTFNEAVKAGTATIDIRSGFNDSLVHSMSVTDTSQVTFSGNQLTINPNTDLAEGASYYFMFGLGSVRDLSDNSFSGVAYQTGYNFTVADPTAPVLLSTNVDNGPFYVDDDPLFIFTFSEAVEAGSGNIEFRDAANGSLIRSIAITDQTQVYFESSVLVLIAPISPLPLGVDYYVTIGSGAIQDQAGNPFAGISSPSRINFSTYPVELTGTLGDDTLTGNGRNELLNGLTGVDTLAGGPGNDIYVIDGHEGGETSIHLHAVAPLFGPEDRFWSYLPDDDDLTIELADLSGDGLIDILAVQYLGDDYQFWTFVFHSHLIGENLTPGETYNDARRASSFIPDHPGLTVEGNGWGSNEVYGTFTVSGLVVDYSDPSNPILEELLVSFEMHSEFPDRPPFYGTINYNNADAGEPTLDTIVEGVNEGNDTVRSAVSYTLGPNLENLDLGQGSGISGIGNAADNRIFGNAADNILDGQAGADTMVGSYGDDTYIVDNVGDKAIEEQDYYGGNDTVLSSVTFALGLYIETLTLTGNANVNGAGNAYGNFLTGNTGNNVLDGVLGNDWITGGAGNDTFTVKSGNGSDTIVDFSAGAAIGEVVVVDGFALGSFSAVQAAMTQSGANTLLNLGNGETLTFLNVLKTSFAANDFIFVNVQGPPPPSGPEPFTLPVSGGFTNTISGTRRIDNLTGTAANNRLDGRQGNDTMTGLAGDDTYIVDASGDIVVEGPGNGIDTVISSAGSYTLANNVENLTLTGTLNHSATGNGLNNLIIASSRPDIINAAAGNDIIQAGTGACVLTGGAGNDIFAFPVAGLQKTIADFQVGEDLVDLRSLLAWYGGSNPVGDGVMTVAATAGGVLVSVKASALGSLQSLVKLTGISVGDVDVGGDILWDS